MIGRITNQMAAQTTLAGIETALDQLDTTQQQLSTGKRINQPSDDPSGTALALKLNTDLANLTNYSNQVTDGTGWSQASKLRAVGRHELGPARSASSRSRRPTAPRPRPTCRPPRKRSTS